MGKFQVGFIEIWSEWSSGRGRKSAGSVMATMATSDV
jgi:hypothetical protein